MLSIREILEQEEIKNLSPHAQLSCKSKGRPVPEKQDDFKTCFQEDLHRIVSSKSFRRLINKTQVFTFPDGDHYRTRLLHTLEVSYTARVISRALHLNEYLAEAIALGHDLGHTPFGHLGEQVLNKLVPDGFSHVRQSLRVVDFLENKGNGLNLSFEVRDGIVKHSKGKGLILSEEMDKKPLTLEGQVVRVSDIIAYLNHDIDDSIRAGLLKEADIPLKIKNNLGGDIKNFHNYIINFIVNKTKQSDSPELSISEEILTAMAELRAFLFKHVYEKSSKNGFDDKVQKLIGDLYHYFLDNPALLDNYYQKNPNDTNSQNICDFIAGMTDNFALKLYNDLFIPQQRL